MPHVPRSHSTSATAPWRSWWTTGRALNALRHAAGFDAEEALTAATEQTLYTEHPLAAAAVDAIHAGDVETLRQLLEQAPELATVRLGTSGSRGMTRTLLHVAHRLAGPLSPRRRDGRGARRGRRGRQCTVHRTAP